MDTKNTVGNDALVEYEIRPKDRISFGFRDLWVSRELLYFYTWRGVRVRYKQAVLGVAWAILQPLFFVGLFTLIFSKGIKIKPTGLPYPVFAFAGLALWHYFNTGVVHAATGLNANAHIIRKIFFPRLVIPLSAVGIAAFDFIFSFAVLLAMAIYHGLPLDWGNFILLALLSILLCTMASAGLGTLLASFHVRFKDFQYLIPFLLQTMLFASPVIYPISTLGEAYWVRLLDFNPVTGPVLLMRSAFSGIPVDWMAVGRSGLTTVLTCIVGLYFFKKLESHLADLI
jgi:lipopolysaccharide transport system permease protein